MVALTLKQLLKRNNLSIFIDKIIKEEAFILNADRQEFLGKEFVFLKKDECLLEHLNNILEKETLKHLPTKYYKNNQLILETTNNQIISSGFLYKTIEFGSVSSQKTYFKETNLIQKLNNDLMSATNNFTNPISLKFINNAGQEVAKTNNVISIRPTSKIKGTYTKSDFELVDLNGNPVFWISHKDGNKASSFRQWSGIKQFEQHEEVVAFEKLLKIKYRNTIKKENIGKVIKDTKLKINAVFGNQEENYGPNRVNLVIQGSIDLKQETKNVYTVTSNSHIFSPENKLSDIPKEYEPIIFATKLNLEPNRCSFGIQGCRGLIYPVKGKRVKLI